jgi:ABC-2 type transport system permease protein
MLGLPWPMIARHEFCCAVLCAGLSGIAVGMGARMPDLRESSPSKISSGFGGTLSLVLSSLFIMAVVVVAAVPSHLSLVANVPAALAWFGLEPGPAPPLVDWAGGPAGTAASLGVVLLLGIAATALPLLLGLRAFRRLEA